MTEPAGRQPTVQVSTGRRLDGLADVECNMKNLHMRYMTTTFCNTPLSLSK